MINYFSVSDGVLAVPFKQTPLKDPTQINYYGNSFEFQGALMHV